MYNFVYLCMPANGGQPLAITRLNMMINDWIWMCPIDKLVYMIRDSMFFCFYCNQI